MPFPPVPPEIKGISHFLKVAEEHDNRNVVVSYWCRMHACQAAMKIVPGKKSPEVSNLLISIMDWLEQTKKGNEAEGIHNETIAQALIEEYAIQLFSYADAQDKAENFNKNVIKAFYTAGILMDVLQQFGEVSEDIQEKRKYAKWKAAYIHTCLKNGEKPLPGAPGDTSEQNNLIEKDSADDNNGEEDGTIPPPATPPAGVPPPATPPSVATPTTPSLPPVYQPAGLPQFPGGPASAVPSVPAAAVTPSIALLPADAGQVATLTAEQIEKAQKYCKWAGSALNYEDVKTAIDNLHKALNLLQHGKE